MRPSIVSVLSITLLLSVSLLILTALNSDAAKISGELVEDRTLGLADSPWLIEATLTVRPDVTLTIRPGVEVHINDGSAITIDGGTVVAEGTCEKPIRFKVIDDPERIGTMGEVQLGADGRLRNCTLECVNVVADAGSAISDCVMLDPSWWGYRVSGSSVRVDRCYVSDAEIGIIVRSTEEVEDIWVVDCTAYNCSAAGISVRNSYDDVHLVGCKVSIGAAVGFDIRDGSSTSTVWLKGCKAIGGRTGFGISTRGTHVVRHCLATDCIDEGFYTYSSSRTASSMLIGCMALRCDDGAYLERYETTDVTKCTFRGNEWAIRIKDHQDAGYTVWNNNFQQNTDLVFLEQFGFWDNGTVGNFWDAYTGSDGNGDGIGDTPFNVNVPGQDDRHPLMAPRDLAAPFAVCTLPVEVEQGDRVTFGGGFSTDDRQISSFSWEVHLPSGIVDLTGNRPSLTFNDTGLFLVELVVTDGQGWTDRAYTWVSVLDTEGPEFTEDLTPEEAFTGDYVGLSCTVTDNVFVTRVWADWRYGTEDPWSRIDLVRQGVEGWSNNLLVPLDQQKVLSYRFTATDTRNNMVSTEYRSVSIRDDDAPMVRGRVTEPSACTGDMKNVTCEATDNWEVTAVDAWYWFGEQEPSVTRLERDAQDLWTGAVAVPTDSLEDLQVRFNASDGSGNWALSQIVRITVSDDDGPTFVDLTEGPFHKGGEAVLKVNVTDNIRVSKAYVETNYLTDDTWDRVSMAEEDGIYVAVIPVEVVGVPMMHYRFSARDTSGNEAVTEAFDLALLGAIPRITTEPRTEVYEGEPYEQVLEVDDPDGSEGEHVWSLTTDAYWLEIEDQTATLKGVAGGDDVGTTTVKLTVKDFDGNTNSITFNITVHDVDFPPEVVISSPEDGVKVKEHIQVIGRATDDADTIVWVRYRIDDGEWTDTIGISPWKVETEVKELDKGRHTLEVKCFDGTHESEVAKLLFNIEREEEEENPGFGILLGILGISAAIPIALRGR